MDLLISRTIATATADLETLQAFLPDFGKSGIRYLLEYGTHARAGETPETAGSFYLPRKMNTYARVAVGRSLRLFQSPWSEACMAYANGLVSSAGHIILPITDTRSGEWTFDSLVAFLGCQPSRKSPFWRRMQYLEFPKRDKIAARPSIFSWYMDAAADVLRTDLQFLVGSVPEAETALSVLAEISADAESVAAVPSILATAMTRQAYYVGGISYKGPIMRFIHDRVSGSRPWTRYIDVGGGYGLLAGELLLDSSVGVKEAATVDIARLNLEFSNVLDGLAREEKHKTLSFALAGVQEYVFDKPCSAISFIGSFLYVPLAERADVLKAAFDTIEPGGVMIIHENIKAPSYTTDFDVMFEPDEIDALMRPHGKIRYFSSTGFEEMDHAKVERRTVFRVVQKA